MSAYISLQTLCKHLEPFYLKNICFEGTIFFSFQFGTSYPLYRYEIVHFTIRKENWEESIHFCTNSLKMRVGITGSSFFPHSFFIFYFYLAG